jgi:hypothetical protein
MAPITVKHLRKVKAYLNSHDFLWQLAALITLNTGMRISEPVLARLADLVLDHDISHLWVRKNSLTDRKTQASIRCAPIMAVSRNQIFKNSFIDRLKGLCCVPK